MDTLHWMGTPGSEQTRCNSCILTTKSGSAEQRFRPYVRRIVCDCLLATLIAQHTDLPSRNFSRVRLQAVA